MDIRAQMSKVVQPPPRIALSRLTVYRHTTCSGFAYLFKCLLRNSLQRNVCWVTYLLLCDIDASFVRCKRAGASATRRALAPPGVASRISNSYPTCISLRPPPSATPPRTHFGIGVPRLKTDVDIVLQVLIPCWYENGTEAVYAVRGGAQE